MAKPDKETLERLKKEKQEKIADNKIIRKNEQARDTKLSK